MQSAVQNFDANIQYEIEPKSYRSATESEAESADATMYEHWNDVDDSAEWMSLTDS